MWEVEAVAYTPQESAGPLFEPIGAFVAPSINWSANLDSRDELRFSCQTGTLDSDILDRLRNLRSAPMEVRLRRDGDLLFAGPIIGGQIQGAGMLSLVAVDASWWLSRAFIDDDMPFTDEDVFTIAVALVEQWQALDFGNFGIDTSGVGTSGIETTITYLAREHHEVAQRITELGQREDGFDWWVTPERELMLAASRGADLTSAVIFDFRNITDASVSFSVADTASDAYGTGTGPDSTPIVSFQFDNGVRTSFGRTAVSDTFDGVSVQATLDDHTLKLLADHSDPWFQPGPGLRPVADTDVTSFGPGDLVAYSYDAGLGLQDGTYRVKSKQVQVDSDGQEAISVEFQ